MKLLTVYKTIKALATPIFRTTDLSVLLGVTNKYGSKILKKLSEEHFILPLRRDLWIVTDSVDPLMVLDYLTMPAPSYVSLQSALYYHGIITQIPEVVYGVSLARTRQYKTSIGVYSFHHINPELFFGFDVIGDHHVRMAQPEKALFDYFYFKAAKTKLFYTLPEIEIPEKFDWNKVISFTQHIKNKSRCQMVLNAISVWRK